MQQIKQGSPGVLYLTLEEARTLALPVYLFLFTYPSGESVSYTASAQADEAPLYKRPRLNRFTLPAALFTGRPSGLWRFKVYEQMDALNQDPAQAAGLVERGILNVLPQVEQSAPESYESAAVNTPIYNG